VTSGTYDNTFDVTQSSFYNPAFVTANGGTVAGAQAALFTSIAAGTAYFNIHTVNWAGGEIRGFLVPVSAPLSTPDSGTTALMLLVALGAMFASRSFRRSFQE
jgi:hypothetical protein